MEIEGYEKLSPLGKKVFDRTHEAHKKVVDDESAWQVVRVKERKKYIEVHFSNEKWLHYMPNGQWY